jgi:chemosensory pili system protein ChpE
MTLFVSAFILGLIFNAAPGAVFAETVRQGARGGYKPALAVQFGSLVGDATWALLGLAGIGLLLRLDWLRVPVGVAGVLYLLYLAWDSWKTAKKEFSIGNGATAQKNALRSGITLSLTNPQNVAYVAALSTSMGALGIHSPTPQDYTVFFAGLMLASFLWCAGRRLPIDSARLLFSCSRSLRCAIYSTPISRNPSRPRVVRRRESNDRFEFVQRSL